jgi:membrane protease YdiL (CAAX protease family)
VADFLRALLDTQDAEFLPGLFFWLSLSGLSAILLYDVWLAQQCTGRSWLPPLRARAVPWGGLTIVAVLFAYVLIPILTADALRNSGFFRIFYGPEFRLQIFDKQDSEAKALALARYSLWISTVSFVPQLVAALALLLVLSGARPYQYGWTTHRLGRNLVIGILAWLIFMPPILAFNAVVSEIYKHWLGGPTEPHALERLTRDGPMTIEWVLVVLSATVMAPIWEEFLFRGVLLAWARQRRGNSDLLIAWSLLVIVMTRGDTLSKALESRAPDDLLLEAQPFLFTIVLLACYLPVRLGDRSRTNSAIYATALLFANAHASVWPSPVPLFFLGLVLAWLAVRTQSLVGPMVLHCLFNGVACATLFFET